MSAIHRPNRDMRNETSNVEISDFVIPLGQPSVPIVGLLIEGRVDAVCGLEPMEQTRASRILIAKMLELFKVLPYSKCVNTLK